MTSYTPRSQQFRGSDASGSDGTSSRTITLDSTSIVDGMVIIVNGTSLHYGASADYTFASGVITFNNVVWNTDYIDVTYFYLATSSTVTNGYCSTQDVLDFMQVIKEEPDYDSGATTKETIGAADGTTATTYYLDHNKVIYGSDDIYYGSSEATSTLLTNPTHYTINLDKGSFTLTSTGNTLVGTATLYGAYKYSSFKDSMIQNLIDAKTALIDGILQRSWQQETINIKEEHVGRGSYSRLYIPSNNPVGVFKGQLNGAVGSTATSFTLDSTDGLSVGDFISIENEAVVVVSVDTSTTITIGRAQLGTTATTHADNTEMINMVLEYSYAPVGTVPTFDFLTYKEDYDVDSESGAVQLLHVTWEGNRQVLTNAYPTHRIFDRVRITYKSGSDSIPEDIKQLCILMVARDLFNASVVSALARGTNGFQTDSIKYINDEIDRIIREHRRMLIDGR